jgi:cytidylate kinase
LEEVTAQDDKPPSTWARLGRAFANMAVPMGPQGLATSDDPDKFREETERILHQIADTTGGVILGRAAMVILRGRPNVLCVRLDGAVEARVARVALSESMDLDAARAMQHHTDHARDSYLRLFYRARQDDPALYDLTVDTASIDLDTCTDLIVLAATAKVPPKPS